MSKSEVSALSSSGGAYNATGSTNASLMAVYFNQYDKNNSDIFANNVSALWIMTYDVNKTTGGENQTVLELVFQSPVAAKLYAKTVTGSTYNATNVTVNGLKYSYSGFSGYGFGGTSLLGYKDNYYVEILGIGSPPLPQAQLASTVAGDLP